MEEITKFLGFYYSAFRVYFGFSDELNLLESSDLCYKVEEVWWI